LDLLRIIEGRIERLVLLRIIEDSVERLALLRIIEGWIERLALLRIIEGWIERLVLLRIIEGWIERLVLLRIIEGWIERLALGIIIFIEGRNERLRNRVGGLCRVKLLGILIVQRLDLRLLLLALGLGSFLVLESFVWLNSKLSRLILLKLSCLLIERILFGSLPVSGLLIQLWEIVRTNTLKIVSKVI